MFLHGRGQCNTCKASRRRRSRSRLLSDKEPHTRKAQGRRQREGRREWCEAVGAERHLGSLLGSLGTLQMVRTPRMLLAQNACSQPPTTRMADRGAHASQSTSTAIMCDRVKLCLAEHSRTPPCSPAAYKVKILQCNIPRYLRAVSEDTIGQYSKILHSSTCRYFKAVSSSAPVQALILHGSTAFQNLHAPQLGVCSTCMG